MDSSDNTTNEITLKVCDDGANEIILQNAADETSVINKHAIEIVSDLCETILDKTSETGRTDAGASDGTTSEVSLDVRNDEDEASEIILQIIEAAYKAVHSTNSSETQSVSDLDLKLDDLESDTSLIVECMDCINDEEIDDREILATTAADFERGESDESIVVESIEACKNYMTVLPAEIIAQPCENDQRVNQNSGNDSDGRKTIVEESVINSTNMVTEFLTSAELYSTEVLRRKGYTILCYDKVKRVVNLVLCADPLGKSTFFCNGLPVGISENKLMPLLEKFGQVFELRSFPGTGSINVTYMTEKECENAIKALNGRKVLGKEIKVEKYFTKTRLIVSQIAIEAKQRDLFDEINKLTPGLSKLHLPSSPFNDRQNRGYCYLDYKTFGSAKKAKDIFSNMNYNGRKVFCDWADKQPDDLKQSTFLGANENKWWRQGWRMIFVNNLRPGLAAHDLRTLFSVYGEILYVDKTDNQASIKFSHPEDAKRAFQNVNKKLLGNENVEISQYHLFTEKPSGLCDKSIAFNKTSIDSTSGSRAGISLVNNNSFGAAGNERHGNHNDNSTPERSKNRKMSPKLGASERYANRQDNATSKIDSYERYGNFEDITNQNVCSSERYGIRQSPIHGSKEQYGNRRNQLPPKSHISTPNNSRFGAIGDNTTTMNKPDKSVDQIFFLK